MNRKKIAAAAQRCLREFGADKLPVEVRKITRGLGAKMIKNSDVDVLEPGVYGLYTTDFESRFIIYDDTLDLEQKRLTVGHEIGHCYLGHEWQYAQFVRKQEEALARLKLKQEEQLKKFGLDQELQAEEFAVQLLCPANELRRRNLTDAEEVARVCKVPLEAAQTSLRGMRT